MTKGLTAWLVAGALWLAASASGDTLTLTDGRVLNGTVTESPGQVTIETPAGTVAFPAHLVAHIRRSPTADSQLAARLAAVRPDDPEGLHQAAVWAQEQGLTRQAEGLWRQVLLVDHDHVGAHRALGHVQVDHRWLEFEPALEVVRSKIASGEADATAEALIQEMLPLAPTPSRAWELRELTGLWRLRRGRFAEARAVFSDLATSAEPGAAALRWAAIEQILAEHSDGMYVLTEAYPPAALLLGPREFTRILPAGPASLAEPLVLDAALRDKARQRLAVGAGLLKEGRSLEPTQPAAARGLYARAETEFNAADALVANIARSYKIEIVRRRIALIRKNADEEAARFDAELATLGRQEMTAGAYADKVRRMIGNLLSVSDDLTSILQLARPYERELILEIKWAELDKTKVEAMSSTLKQELNDARLGRLD